MEKPENPTPERTAVTREPDAYEAEAIRQLTGQDETRAAWLKSPIASEVSRRIRAMPKGKVEDVAGATFGQAAGQGLKVAHRLVARTLWARPFYDGVSRAAGREVRSQAEVQGLPLEVLDQAARRLPAKYMGVAAASGAGVGAFGVPGLLADVPLVLLLALRAVLDHRLHYGVLGETAAARRLHEDEDLGILALALLPEAMADASADELGQAALAAARGNGLGVAGSFLVPFVGRRILQRLARRKVAQAVPLVGVAVGGGVNAVVMRDVCRLARARARRAFLSGKFGPSAVGG